MKRGDKLSFKEIFNDIVSYKKEVIRANIIAIIATIIALPVPLLIPLLIDEVLLKQGNILTNFMGEHQAYFYVWSIFGVAVVLRFLYFIMSSYQTLLFARISKKIVLNIQTKMLKHLKKISMPEYELIGNGKISSYFLIDLLTLDKFLSVSLNKFIISIISLIAIFTIVFLIHWQLALLIFIVNPFVAVLTKKIAKKVAVYKKEENKAFSIFTDSLNETLDMFVQLKALSKEKLFFEDLNKKSNNIKDKSINFTYKSTLSSSFSYFIFLSGFEMFRAMGILFVFYDDLSIGLMLSIFGYLWVIMGPIQSIIDIQYSYHNAKAAMSRINELFNIKTEINTLTNTQVIENKNIDIQIKNLTFGYTNNLVLKDINFNIYAKSKVALVGESGSGKSTLAKIIVGLYKQQNGDILLNNINTHNIKLENLRQNIYLVLQQSFMFNSTIRENLTLGSNIEDNKLVQALRDVELWDVINEDKNGLDTVVGKNGIRLSGGQAQRVAIARMILQNPKVVIFDESTSAVDIELETRIFKNIEKFLEDKTVIYIAHRNSTLMYANEVLKI